jgi:hypothetical protein
MGKPTKLSPEQDASKSQSSPAEHIPEQESSKRRNEDGDEKGRSHKWRKANTKAREHGNKKQDMGRREYLYEHLQTSLLADH